VIKLSQTIEIGGTSYAFEEMDRRICLSRYNEKHKIHVNIYIPKHMAETKDMEAEIVEALSKLYIERQAAADGSNG